MKLEQRCLPVPERQGRPVPESGASDEELAKLARAVAHPTRVRLLRIPLARQAYLCGELVEMMPLAQSTVSQHLKILKECGLMQGEIDGPRICYCVNSAGLNRLQLLIAAL